MPADRPNVKPGSLRTGPGIDPDLPYMDTPDGPVQVTGNQPEQWSAADLTAADLVDDEFIRRNSEEV